jgi:hypothetical protein
LFFEFPSKILSISESVSALKSPIVLMPLFTKVLYAIECNDFVLGLSFFRVTYFD